MGKMSPESRKRQAAARKNKIAVHNLITGVIKYVNPDELSDYEAQGFVKGTGRVVKSVLGKIWVHNDMIEKYINEEELETFINLGFVRGRLKKDVVPIYE